MARLSTDLTMEEHQQLEAMAALKGRSVKDYLLSCTLVDRIDPGAGTDVDVTAQEIRREARARIREQSRQVGEHVAASPEAARLYEDWGTPTAEGREQ